MRRTLLLALALSAAGCGGPGPVKFPVAGTVTVDGQPLAEGAVTFRPKEPGLPPEGAEVRGGSFRLRAAAGRYRVEVSAPKRVPGYRGSDEMGPTYREGLPAKYNTATALAAEVTPKGANAFQFDTRSR